MSTKWWPFCSGLNMLSPPSHVPYLSRWLGEGMDDGAGITAVNHEGVGSPPQHVVDQGLQVRQWGVDTHHTQVSAKNGFMVYSQKHSGSLMCHGWFDPISARHGLGKLTACLTSLGESNCLCYQHAIFMRPACSPNYYTYNNVIKNTHTLSHRDVCVRIWRKHIPNDCWVCTLVERNQSHICGQE